MKLKIIYYTPQDRTKPAEPLAICEIDKAELLIAEDIQYSKELGENLRRDQYHTDDWTLNTLWYKEVTS